MKMKLAPPVAPPWLQRWRRLVLTIEDLADAVFRLAFRPSLFNAIRTAWNIPSVVYVPSVPLPSSLGPPPEASCEHKDLNGDQVGRKYGNQHGRFLVCGMCGTRLKWDKKKLKYVDPKASTTASAADASASPSVERADGELSGTEYVFSDVQPRRGTRGR